MDLNLRCRITGHRWDGENARCIRCKAWNPRLKRARPELFE